MAEPREHRGRGQPSGVEGGCGCRHAVRASAGAVSTLLPTLDHVLAVTRGRWAMLAAAGRYAVPSVRGHAFGPVSGRTVLRLDPERLTVVHESSPGDSTLSFEATTAHTSHRVLARTAVDRLVLDGLARPDAFDGSPACPAAAPAPHWRAGDQLAQLDAVLAGEGRERRRALTDDDAPLARRFDDRLVPEILEHLCATGVPIGVAVFAPGVVQLETGVVHATSADESGTLTTRVGDATLRVALPAVRDGLLVTTHGPHGPTSALELHDDDADVVAMLGQFGLVHPEVHRMWAHLTASLPAAERG